MIHPQAPIIYSTFQVFGPFPAGPCRIRPRAIPSNRSFLSDHFSQHHISCTWELHLRVQKVTSAQHNRQTLIYIYIHAHMCTFLLLEVRIHMYSTLQYINMSPMFLVVLFSISTHTYNIYIIFIVIHTLCGRGPGSRDMMFFASSVRCACISCWAG